MIDPTPTTTTTPRQWTASELRRLPPAERDAILSAAADAAAPLYRDNPKLTEFEAFDEEEFHGGSADAGPG